MATCPDYTATAELAQMTVPTSPLPPPQPVPGSEKRRSLS